MPIKPSKKPTPYDPAKIEPKWQKKWASLKLYKACEDADKEKYYVLDMFPYPSGEGLHVGHPKGYIATDVISRMKRMQGLNVLHPMGFDAFGLPAENYAIKMKINPDIAVKKNVARFKSQLELIGLDYDWSREVNTTDPEYYRWTQWIFLQLFKQGLAYESYEPVNWCPTDKTVLANEDVENGRCERCGTPVEKKPLRQWVLKITDYADRLLRDLDVQLLPNKDFYGTRTDGDPYVVHMNDVGPGKVRPDKSFVEREAISAFVEHWSEDKFIVLKWKKVDWMTPITGGIEKGQTAEDAARAEIFEETGFKNLELVKKAEKKMHSTFFHVPKDENRIGHFTCFHFKLKDGEKLEIADKEKDIHEITWVERNKMRETITAQAQKIAWALVMDEKIGEGTKPLLDWPESIKEAQRNWIGRSEGSLIKFKVKKQEAGAQQGKAAEQSMEKEDVEVFTTRPDTLFGVTYLVLAPEHPWIKELLPRLENKAEVEAYIEKAQKETEIERTDAKKEKTGVELKGLKAINPANNEEIPVWIADYVLADYGTGAVMAVPAHDERDFQFAQKYELPIRAVVQEDQKTKILFVIRGMVPDWKQQLSAFKWQMREDWGVEVLIDNSSVKEFIPLAQSLTKEGPYYASTHGSTRYIIYKNNIFDIYIASENEKAKAFGRNLKIPENELDWSEALIDKGFLVNSGKFSEKRSDDVMKEITTFAGGRWVTKYKLRDWVFSRQRYWGEPIPLIRCEKCGIVPVAEKDLPVKLPKVDSYEPTGTGESPLAAISKWVNVKCPKCKGPAKRETNTMPQWAGSCWYYLRYEDPKNKKTLVDLKKEKYWSPVDLYVGGAEHATRHLIYARFWHKFLNDIGVVSTSEPFTKLQSVGLIMGEDGRKMSKRFGNVVNPDDIVAQFGADTLRIYEMFMGPFDQSIAWSTESMVGPRRFIERVWKLSTRATEAKVSSSPVDWSKANLESRDIHPRTFENFASVAYDHVIHRTIKKVTEDISAMRFNTAISTLMITVNALEKAESISREQFETLLKLLAPFAPHVTEELWTTLGNKKSIHISEWPKFDPKLIVDDEANIIVQINGKVRASFMAASDSTEEVLKSKALVLPETKKWTEGKSVKKVIVIKGKLVSIVAA